MKTIKYFIFLLMFASATLINAQTKIKFTYDDAGNRTKREIILGKSALADFDTTKVAEPLIEWLEKMKITIYPNPTRGELTIHIANIPQDASGEITIHNTEGKRLQHIDKLNAANQLNLSLYPTGIYILRIRSGQISCEWKIVKE